MNFERNRLDSFEGWKYIMSKNELAYHGFYRYGKFDTVKCNFCSIEIGNLPVDVSVYEMHKTVNENCPLLQNKPTANIPFLKEKKTFLWLVEDFELHQFISRLFV
jgi:hypothetical protein